MKVGRTHQILGVHKSDLLALIINTVVLGHLIFNVRPHLADVKWSRGVHDLRITCPSDSLLLHSELQVLTPLLLVLALWLALDIELLRARCLGQQLIKLVLPHIDALLKTTFTLLAQLGSHVSLLLVFALGLSK